MKKLIILLILCLAVSGIYAQNVDQFKLSPQEKAQLEKIKTEYQNQQNISVEKAKQVVKGKMNPAQLKKYLNHNESEKKGEAKEETVNTVIWVLGIIFCICIVYLFIHYKSVIILEVIGWALSITTIAGGFGTDKYVILIGALGIAALTYIMESLHEVLSHGMKNKEHAFSIYTFVLAIVWGGVAIQYQLSMIGFLSVLALVASLSVEIFVLNLILPFEIFEEGPRKGIIAFTKSCGLLLLLGIAQQLGQINIEHLHLFLDGIWFVGKECFFAGLLLLTVKYLWDDKKNSNYCVLMNVLFIISLICTLFLSVYLDIPVLKEVFGSFIVIWLAKVFLTDIPWEGVGWIWAILILSGLAYPLMVIVQNNPEYFDVLFSLFK